MGKTKYDHLHIYGRMSLKSPMWRCVRDECPHIIHKNALIGRAAECKECGTKLIITKEHLDRKVVKCLGVCNSGESVQLQLFPSNIAALKKIDDNPFAELLRKGKENSESNRTRD